MKIQKPLLTIGAVALTAITINAFANDTLLSPRAAGNQVQQVSGTATGTSPVSPTASIVSPRATGNQPTSVTGVANDVNPAAACRNSMSGSPKAVQACAEHPANMALCPMAGQAGSMGR